MSSRMPQFSGRNYTTNFIKTGYIPYPGPHTYKSAPFPPYDHHPIYPATPLYHYEVIPYKTSPYQYRPRHDLSTRFASPPYAYSSQDSYHEPSYYTQTNLDANTFNQPAFIDDIEHVVGNGNGGDA
ncbi:hypothetical protein M422DRAFT_256660 [Sphaerobolus stellatus SS14]|uniref:Uncharacterized protein n=1 Tax=Sphaerobolus stellatus (strain SS14) TaxID=990650 RepID=A0A0C9VR84_SPHS4|nr:hypothetical protein M422DRAFT_256660 [Sphaerobolus stellatus SS14]